MTFANTEWFFTLLVLVPLGMLALRAHRLRHHAVRKFAGAPTHPRGRSGPNAMMWTRAVLLTLALVMTVAALARPQWGHHYSQIIVKGRNVLIALDLSNSMRAEDVKPNRLGLARVAVLNLSEELPGDRLGFIAFSGQARLLVPLTLYHPVFRDALQQVSTDTLPRGGSNIATTINLAVDTFENLHLKGDNTLVIVSDGETHEGDFESALERARDANVHIISIGVGTSEGASIPLPRKPSPFAAANQEETTNFNFITDRSGRKVVTRFQGDQLRQAANDTNGKFIRLEGGGSIAPAVRNAIRSMESFELDRRQTRRPIERYFWPLGIAASALALSILLPWLFRLGHSWRQNEFTPKDAASATTAVATLLLLPLFFAFSSYDDFADEKYADSRNGFEDAISEGGNKRELGEWHIGSGASAYKLEKFADSLEPFANALLSPLSATREKGHYNLGNTLFRIGESELSDADVDDREEERTALNRVKEHWLESIEHYEAALAIDRDNEKTIRNLEIVRERLRELEERLKQDPPPEPEEEEKKPDKGGDSGRTRPEGRHRQEMKNPEKEDPNSRPEIDSDTGEERERDTGSGGSKEENRELEPQAGDEANVDGNEGEIERRESPRGDGKKVETRTLEGGDPEAPMTPEEARDTLQKYSADGTQFSDSPKVRRRRSYKDW